MGNFGFYKKLFSTIFLFRKNNLIHGFENSNHQERHKNTHNWRYIYLMIFLLFTLPLVVVFAYVIADKLLYININKLTAYDPANKNNTPNKRSLKNFSKLFTVQDKKWNKRLRLFFIFTMVLYFTFISTVIYEIIQYEHIDDSKLIDNDEKLQQVFIINFCIPIMLKLLSIFLSFVIPFIIIFLGLQK